MDNNYYMDLAFKEGLKAYNINEIPVGCVIVENDKIVGRGYNQRIKLSDPTAHAEIIAIRNASKMLGDWRLDNCVLYTTLEPCDMCITVIAESRIKKVYYCFNKKSEHLFDKKINIEKINCNIEYENLLTDFFVKMRNK